MGDESGNDGGSSDDALPPVTTHNDAAGKPMRVGGFYIVRPHSGADAFYLWRVKMLVTASCGAAAVRCQEYNLCEGEKDAFTGSYEVHKNHAPGTR